MNFKSQSTKAFLSIIIPVKNNPSTIALCVESLLSQAFDGDFEVIVVVDRNDSSHLAIKDMVEDSRLVIIHPTNRFPVKGRDSNWRRSVGMSVSKGDILALTDADMIFGPEWAQRGVDLIRNNGVHCVAGVMQSVDQQSFWGRYIDRNIFGAKTPRFSEPQILSTETFGSYSSKPGVTANMFLTRVLHRNVGYPRQDFVYTYEDYAYFQEILSAGYAVLCTPDITGKHYHRQSLWKLCREYQYSGQGCGDFVNEYPESPFAKRRSIQLAVVLLMMCISMLGMWAWPMLTITVSILGLLVLGLWTAWKLRYLSAFLYPFATLILGLNFCYGFIRGLIRGGPPYIEGSIESVKTARSYPQENS